MKQLFLFALCLSLAACAVDRPPTGGPKDTAPLEIVSVSPPTSSVNIFPERILFHFNRYVSLSSLERSLSFTPAITGYTLEGGGKEAAIVFTEPLGRNKTYTFTLNTSLRSSRGNQLPQSYNYAFSTGPEINRGIIAGQVFSEDARPLVRALVLAYAVSKDDTLSPVNPFQQAPDYRVGSGENGSFTFEYLAEGFYRLIALQDRNGDRKPNPESEPFGVGYRRLIRTGTADNMFRLAEPRGVEKLIDCTALQSNLLEVSFNRPLPVEEFDCASLVVLDTARNMAVPLKGFYSTRDDREAMTLRIVTSSALEKKSGYRVTYSPGGIGQVSRAVCRGSDKKQKEPLALAQLLPKDGEKTAFLTPAYPERGRTVDLSFSAPVEQQSLQQAVTLYEVTGEAAFPHGFSISRIDDRRYTLRAEPAFRNGLAYRVEMQMEKLTGLTGERAIDSLVTSSFTVANSGDFGAITGTVSGGTGTVVVEALDSFTRLPRRTVVRRSGNTPADFTIDELAPGKYTLMAFIPRSSAEQEKDVSWNPGKVYPFEPADLFTVKSDTVTVRKGWATEDIDLVFPAVMP